MQSIPIEFHFVILLRLHGTNTPFGVFGRYRSIIFTHATGIYCECLCVCGVCVCAICCARIIA